MPSNQASAGERTFAIVELAEKILLHLEMVQIFQAQRVDKYTQQVIANSLALQQKLHLAALPGDEPKEVLQQWVTPDHMSFHITVNCKSTLDIKHCLLPHDSSWKSILLTQPPIYSATLRRTCFKERSCPDRRRSYPPEREIQNEAGTTLGDVDKAAQVFHRLVGWICG